MASLAYRESGVWIPCVTLPCYTVMEELAMMSPISVVLLCGMLAALVALSTVRVARLLGAPVRLLMGSALFAIAFCMSVLPVIFLSRRFCLAWNTRGLDSIPELAEALQLATGGLPGTFVEIGANDGRTSSNTLALERCFGWHGLLIEGNTANFKLLQRSGRSSAMVHSAICAAPSDGRQPYVEFTASGGLVAGQVDAFSDTYTRQWGKHNRPNVTVRVACKPMSTIMHDVGLPAATFFSLDVEGAEEIVLKTVNASSFSLLLVEWDAHNGQQKRRIHQRLVADGMEWAKHMRLGANRLYIRRSQRPPARATGK